MVSVDLNAEPTYLSAEEEEGMFIAQANIEMNDDGKITWCRECNCSSRRRFSC